MEKQANGRMKGRGVIIEGPRVPSYIEKSSVSLQEISDSLERIKERANRYLNNGKK